MKCDRPVASGSTIDDGGAMFISPLRVQETGSGTRIVIPSPTVFESASRRRFLSVLSPNRRLPLPRTTGKIIRRVEETTYLGMLLNLSANSLVLDGQAAAKPS